MALESDTARREALSVRIAEEGVRVRRTVIPASRCVPRGASLRRSSSANAELRTNDRKSTARAKSCGRTRSQWRHKGGEEEMQ